MPNQRLLSPLPGLNAFFDSAPRLARRGPQYIAPAGAGQFGQTFSVSLEEAKKEKADSSLRMTITGGAGALPGGDSERSGPRHSEPTRNSKEKDAAGQGVFTMS